MDTVHSANMLLRELHIQYAFANIVHKLASGTLKPKNPKKYRQSKNEAPILRTCCAVVAYLVFFISGVPILIRHGIDLMRLAL